MSWLLPNTAVAALLGAGVLAVGRWLRPAPVVMHALWLLVLLKLALPPLLLVPVPWPHAAPQPAVVVVDPLAGAGATAGASATMAPGLASAETVRTGVGAAVPRVALAWLAGSTLVALLGVIGIAGQRRRIGAMAPAPDWLHGEVEAIARQLGVRVPPLRDDPDAHSPAVACIPRAHLLLPARVLAAVPPRGRAAVIAHELAHLRRRDHLVAWLEFALAILLWWQPLFWFARAQMRAWAELACDAWAVDCVPGGELDYAGVLVAAVAAPVSAAPSLTVLAARPAARAAFERRLTMILNERVACRAPRGWWSAFAAVGFLAVSTPVMAQDEEPPVRIEVRVNGRKLEDLSEQERRRAIELLRQGGRGEGRDRDAEMQPRPPSPQPKAKGKGKGKQKAQQPQPRRSRDADETVELGELGGLLQHALQSVRGEILADADLRELGIQDEVVHLVDALDRGDDVGSAIDDIVKGALKGAGAIALREIRDDADLRQLGIADDVGALVQKVVDGEEAGELLGALTRKAATAALGQVKAELRGDPDLQRLGIEGDVEHLIDAAIEGDGDFGGALQQVIDKAMHGALRSLRDGDGGERRDRANPAPRHDGDDGERDEEAPPPPPAPRKSKLRKGRSV